MKIRRAAGPKATSSRGITRRQFVQGTASAAAAAVLVTGGCSSSSSDTPYDVVIKGGTIYDGTTAAPYVTDLAVVGDRIVRIGAVEGAGKTTIGARGLIVTPGFVDVHDHTDWNFLLAGAATDYASQVPEWSGAYNVIYQGITTVVSGNCGFGYADMNKYFAFLDSLPLGTNSAYLTPHGMLRFAIAKEDARALDGTELAKLKDRVAAEMDTGAIGVSSGLGYIPGFGTPPDELIAVASVVKRYDGIYASHIRADPEALFDGSGNAGMQAAVEEAIEVGRRTGVRVQISHIQLNLGATPAEIQKLLDSIENARREGIDVTLDQYPYLFGGQNSTVLAPVSYQTIQSKAGAGFFIKEEYRDGKVLAPIVEERLKHFSPEHIWVPYAYPGENDPTFANRTLATISADRGKPVSEVWVELACGKPEKPDEPYKPASTLMYTVDEAAMNALMPKPYVFTAADGGAMPPGPVSLHPRVYGTFPRKLKRCVLEKKTLELQDAIRSMTSLPAEKFGLARRGTLAEGNFADIAVIDLDSIEDRSTPESPTKYAVGVVHLLVNGVLAIENRIATGKRGGVTMRRKASAA